MNWTKLLYVLIIVLLYVPMVFMGANVFFPKYTGTDSYYQGPDCYSKYPYPATEKVTEAQSLAISEKQQKCQEEYWDEQKAWEEEKNAYEGQKYMFMIIFNLIILILALLVKFQESIIMGLFMGSIVTTFIATLVYFQSKSKIGFMILVITFFVTLYFINRKKESFLDWKEKKR